MAPSAFPIFRTERTLPGKAAGVRAGGLDVSVAPTGIIGLGGAVLGLGKTLLERQKRLVKQLEIKQEKADLIEADNQLSESTREANRVSNEINDLVRQAPDASEETFTGISKSINERILALRPKNERAARQFDRRMSVLIPRNEEFVANARLQRIETNFLAEEQALLNEVKLGGSLEDYMIHLQKGKILGIAGRQSNEQLKPLQQAGRAISVQAAIIDALNGDDLTKAQALLLQAKSLTPSQVKSLKNAIKAGQKVIEDRASEQAKEVLLAKIKGLPAEDAFVVIDSDTTIPFSEKKSVRQEWSIREGILRAEQTAAENLKEEIAEKELYKQYVTGGMTIEGNNQLLLSGGISPELHNTYNKLLENKALMSSDSVLAEKWLNNALTTEDIQIAQKEGRLRDSNVVAAWLSRIAPENEFNVSVYDAALIRIREVRDNKAKYNEVRLWLLDNAGELGFKWDEVRNRLETAMNVERKDPSVKTPHITRAHKFVDAYAKDNPEINDGTIESIRKIQQIHDAIDARADYTPEQIRNLTQALLLPYEEEKAKGWLKTVFEYPLSGIARKTILKGTIRKHAKRERIFQATMLIQPVSKDEFKDKVNGLKEMFGEDSKEARLFYDKYIDSYDWEVE